jgi:hypothetical protein
MLHDPGAAFFVISKHVWLRIGSPPLSPTPDLLAYSKVPVKTLGSATATVDASHRRKSLSRLRRGERRSTHHYLGLTRGAGI